MLRSHDLSCLSVFGGLPGGYGGFRPPLDPPSGMLSSAFSAFNCSILTDSSLLSWASRASILSLLASTSLAILWSSSFGSVTGWRTCGHRLIRRGRDIHESVR